MVRRVVSVLVSNKVRNKSLKFVALKRIGFLCVVSAQLRAPYVWEQYSATSCTQDVI
jgi:hypothetical protein